MNGTFKRELVEEEAMWAKKTSWARLTKGRTYRNHLVKKLQIELCVLSQPLHMMLSTKHAALPIFQVV